jgi:ATP-dependent DNA helicase RecQ
LRAWRREVAREHGVPPYVIFHDAHLAAIAARDPHAPEARAGVPGVGAAKLERYGAALLDVLAAGRARRDEGIPSSASGRSVPPGAVESADP